MTHEIIISGFGGQGALFAGKLLAYAGMILGKEVSWCPAYGPEMRGGTANCSTIISDELIGSPMIQSPTMVIAMNKPSFDKYIDSIVSGGIMLVDSSLIDNQCDRKDITFVAVPATAIANDMQASGLSNMVLLGQLSKQTGLFTVAELEQGLSKAITARKKDLFDLNMKAINLGYEFIA